MNLMTVFPFCEYVKRHILEFDPHPKEIHSERMRYVLDDLVMYCVYKDSILYNTKNKYSHFRSSMIYF